MTGAVFVDTNVLVYARDLTEGVKNAAAVEWMKYLWSSRRGRVSMQVLQEYYVTVTRKLRPGLDREQARKDARALRAWQPLEVDDVVLEGAWRVEDRYGLSWWDSLIVSAAQVLECRYLLTEDLNQSQEFDGVVVVSPFAQNPESLMVKQKGRSP